MKELSERAGKGDLKAAQLLKKPKSLKIIEKKGKLIILKSWRSSTAIGLFVAMLIWTSLCLVGGVAMLVFIEGIGKFFMVIIPLFLTSIGVYVLSKVVMGVFNESTITITPEYLEIKTTPIAKRTNKRLRRHEIKQVFVKSVKFETNKQAGVDNEANRVYGLYYIDMHSRTKPLFLELPVINTPFPTFKPAEGQYLEQKIEQFWSINNEEVKDVKLVDVKNNEGAATQESEHLEIVSIPAGLELVADEEELIIVREWKTPLAYMLLLVGFMFGAFALLLLGGGLFNVTNGTDTLPASIFTVCAGLGLLVAAGIPLKKGLAMRLNKTTLHLSPTDFQLRHAPFYRNKGVTLPLEDVERVYVEEEKVVSRASNSNMGGGTTKTYYVNVLKLKKRNMEEPIVLGLGSSTPVDNDNLYVAYKIKEYLKKIKE